MIDKGQLAIEFFHRYLRHTKGKFAGQPFLLEAWQQRIIRDLFGTLRPDGTRRYRTAYIEIPRKNGKSTLAAGIALYLLFADREPGAEIYSAASTRDQATIVFNQAASMVRKSPRLLQKCKILDSIKRINNIDADGFYRAVPADAAGAHGYNASGIVVDELHVQPNRNLWDVLTTSTGARSQPLTIAITTAGYDRDSICWEMHTYAEQVRDGIIEDESFYPCIYGADPHEDWQDPKVWAKANPCLGASLYESYLQEAFSKAKGSAERENTFRNLHLNQWTEQAVRWIQMSDWDECVTQIDTDSFIGEPCYGGLDLSSTSDTTCLSLVFPPNASRDYYFVMPYFWVPEDEVDARARGSKAKYNGWVKENLLETTPGARLDYAWVRAKVNELSKKYRIEQIAFDPWNATQLAQQLDEQDGITMVELRQGYQHMNEPCKEFERLIKTRNIRHDGHKVLRWQVSNVVVKKDPLDNIRPDKQSAGDKIDGVVATVMALSRAGLCYESVYESRGLMAI